MTTSDLASYIRSIPDFPKKGIVFRDITTLLKDPDAFRRAIDTLAVRHVNRGITKVVGIESRGFLFGAPLAMELGAGFVPIRKKGKLPAPVLEQQYALEYGTDSIEIHKDAIDQTDTVLMTDDLLATGGTMSAACKLVEQLGGSIAGITFLIELSFLGGRKLLGNYEVFSLIPYDRE